METAKELKCATLKALIKSDRPIQDFFFFLSTSNYFVCRIRLKLFHDFLPSLCDKNAELRAYWKPLETFDISLRVLNVLL